MARELTFIEQMFICEYIVDWNATAAIQRVPGYTGKWPGSDAARMLKNERVAEEVKKCRDQLVGTVQLSIKMVVQDIVNVLEADPNELIETVNVACRFCHGENHLYQRTQREYMNHEESWRQACEAAAAKGKPIPVFDPQGGMGWNPYKGPHADCPECHGKGEIIEELKDTRFLSPAAKALYNGVERTKYGLRINMRSKDAARQQAALYLGMNKETLKVQKTKASELTDDELAAIARGELDE